MFGDLFSMPMQVNGLSASPLQQMGGPDLSSLSAQMPQMGGGGGFAAQLGSALGGGSPWSQPTGSGLGAYHPVMSHGGGLLSQILGNTSSPTQSGGLAALLMRLGIMH